MSEPIKQTLDIPHGVSFTIVENSVILGNEADVVIRGDLGYKLKKVFSRSGNVQIIPPEGTEMEIEELEAEKGDVFINGRVRSRRVRAQRVFFDEGFLRADQIKGEKEVHLKGKRFQVYLVSAPTVTIDAEAQGLALVVECKHEVPRGQYMGGFRNVQEARDTFSSFMRAFAAPEGEAAAQAQAAAAAAGVEGAAGDDTKESVKKFFQKR
jgi:hypothetical protein